MAYGLLYSSTYGIRRRMRSPSRVRLAIDPLAARRLWSNAFETPVFTNRIRKLL